MMRKAFEEIGNYMQERELVISFLLTGVFLFLSFVGCTKFSTTEITVVVYQDVGPETHTVHISYYGFPFEMVGMLNPLTTMERYYLSKFEAGLLQIFWGGIVLNFVLYFLLVFTLVYLFRRWRSKDAT